MKNVFLNLLKKDVEENVCFIYADLKSSCKFIIFFLPFCENPQCILVLGVSLPLLC